MTRDNGKTDDFELDDRQIRELLNLAKLNKNDIFYDLGSATGRVIFAIAKNYRFKKSIGIEYEKSHYNNAKKKSYKLLSKEKLSKIDFWLGEFYYEDSNCYSFDFSDATIIYNGLEEVNEEVSFYKRNLKHKRVRIIKKDLPLVGYKFVANRTDEDCWFFLMRYPFIPVKSLKEWISSVLETKTATLEKLCEYYKIQLKKRDISKKEINETILDLKKLVNKRF